MSSTIRRINSSEIEYDPTSTGDPFGRVFWYREKIYRTVEPGSVDLAKEILNRAKNWQKSGLVATEQADFSLYSHPLVLAHDTVHFRSYISEWTPTMLKDAALTYLRLQLALVEEGFVLKDGHPWNMLFDGCSPVHVDVGSIQHFEPGLLNGSCGEFRLYFYLPLFLYRRWGLEKTFEILKNRKPEGDHGKEDRNQRKKIASQLWIPKFRKPKWLSPRLHLQRLIRRVERMPLPKGTVTERSSYSQDRSDIDGADGFVDKDKAVHHVFKIESPCRVLDIGGSTDWHSRLAASMGCAVARVVNDTSSVDALYARSQSERLNITTLLVDIYNPIPASELNNAFPDFIHRAKSDIVMLLDSIHHLAYGRRLRFEKLSERISDLADGVAIVEFIPIDDAHVASWDQVGMEWYTRDNFIKAFQKDFSSFDIFPSTPHPREIFIFRK
jgi:hypothetical protein